MSAIKVEGTADKATYSANGTAAKVNCANITSRAYDAEVCNRSKG